MSSIEILAPAGGIEQLRAAVISGANAVYLGASNFNARRNAENFTDEALTEAVKYCHLRNVRVYVTLNTLIFDKELSQLKETATAIVKSGADAVIIQDLAAYRVFREIAPDFPVHASTQMAVHNVSGAKLLEKMGFSRIVLARELSAKEIKRIRESVNAEIEVFVHGAHCMSTSGNCYLSAMLGERSGNRGLCAQGCRLNWKNIHGREYALSLKDMSLLDNINALYDTGVHSLKIEGRMKRPEYVAASVSSLKNALENKSYNKELLRSVFSRSGFTDGYFTGNRNTSMFGYRKKEDVTAAAGVFKELEALYRNDIHPRALKAELTLTSSSSTLTLTSGTACVTVPGDIPETPRTAPLSEEIARRSISKLGDTAFYLSDFIFNNNDLLTLSAASINQLRRTGVKELEDKLTRVNTKTTDAELSLPEGVSANEKPQTRVRLRYFSQYSPALDSTDFLILPIDEILKNKEKISELPLKVGAELPQLIYPEQEDKILQKLSSLKEIGITHGFTGNIGGIHLLREANFKIHGTHGLNITNSVSAKEYEQMGVTDICLSFELTCSAAESIRSPIPYGVYVYGYLPLMLFRSCPQKGQKGCEDCKGSSALTDRKGISFPLLCHNKHYSVLHNSVPMYIGDKVPHNIPIRTLYFTTESPEQCKDIYLSCIKGKSISGQKTNGLWLRELL